MRTIFIGDVHGCDGELELLIKKLAPLSTDRVLFLGDLINRGPNSLRVLEIAKDLKAEAILGNHEIGFINYVKSGQYHESSFETVRLQLQGKVGDWIDWIESWPLYRQTDDWLAVHAGLHPELPVEETSASFLTRIRTWDGTGENLKSPDHPPWHQFYRGEKMVIYGHYAQQGLHITENTIGIDTGCVWGGRLTALIWPALELVQVPALKQHCPFPK